MPRLLVLGARNLGRVVAEHLTGQGWEAVGVARSQETAAAFPGHGIVADLTKADEMRRAVAEAGEFDLAVNAVSPKGRFGGGDLTTTDDDALSPYLEQLLPEVFAFFRVCGGSLAAANELKPRNVHAALLVCDGSFGEDDDDAGGERIPLRELAKTVQFLHEQGRGAWTHELVVTPVGDRWTR